jgi:Rrf2 family protein
VKLSAKADYAVRAVLVLAAHEGPGPMKGELIAGSQKLPLKFVENILGELKHAGIVVSQRGPEGGYQLAVPPESLSVAEVIRVVDGPLAMAPCVSPRLGLRKCDDCPDLALCTLREALARARDATAEVLEAYSLAEAAGSGTPDIIRSAV